MSLLSSLFQRKQPKEPVLIDLVEIPEGPFLMGTQVEDLPVLMERFKISVNFMDAETPLHQVTLPLFRIGRTPVTVAQFRTFLEASGYEWKSAQEPQGGDDHPVVYVTCYDAEAYCKWLNETWHASRQISAGEMVLLPSEAEWEKAARGTDTRIFPWGDESPDAERCNCYPNVNMTTPVGAYSPQGDSPFGCTDMAGNVWEWTRSHWGLKYGTCDYKYPYQPDDGREDPDIYEYVRRVMRGGAYTTDVCLLRVTYRQEEFRETKEKNIGFRISVSPVSLSNLRGKRVKSSR